jgi:uncharacterized protein YrrD
MFVDRGDIVGIGKDAVTVATSDAVRTIETQTRAHEVVDSGIHLRGVEVLTEGGDSLGSVDKVLVEEDGTISGYEVSSGPLGLVGMGKKQIDAGDIVKIGGDRIIVADTVATEDPESGAGV